MKKALILLSILFLFVFSSCDYEIKTWNDPNSGQTASENSGDSDDSTPTSINPTTSDNDNLFKIEDNAITFSSASSVSSLSGTFVKSLENSVGLKDFSLKARVVSGNKFYYGVALLVDNSSSEFKAVFISDTGEIRIGGMKGRTWSEKIRIEESVNIHKGLDKENNILLLFNEQVGNFSLFINSIHECDFYLDEIRTLNDFNYYLCVSTTSSSPVVEFKLKEEI